MTVIDRVDEVVSETAARRAKLVFDGACPECHGDGWVGFEGGGSPRARCSCNPDGKDYDPANPFPPLGGWPAADWYYASYPDGPRHNPRCLQTLCSFVAPYNMPLSYAARRRPDGGFRALSFDAVQVILQQGCELATFDFDQLTRLVVAAHRYSCRVSVRAQGMGHLAITVHPRKLPEPGDHGWERHPTLDDLAARR